MKNEISKIALGGGCHWCTEAVFQSLKGVVEVEQGYVSSVEQNNSFSEAVIVHFNRERITLYTLIEIHLLTHHSTSNHSMRTKYRSAIYTFDEFQKGVAAEALKVFQKEYHAQLVIQIMDFDKFEPSREEITNYYFKNPEKPFCESYINPKLKMLLHQFKGCVDHDKLGHLEV